MLDRLQRLLDVGRNPGIVRDPAPAHDPAFVDNEHGAAAHVPKTAVRLVWRVGDAELVHHLAVEVAQQREWDLELLSESGMSAVALDAHAEHAGTEHLETAVVLTEPLQLERSDPSEVEQVPRQDDRPAFEIAGQRDGLAKRGRQRK